MTSDYVSWVLGLQGWERAWREDSYFAGEEDVLGSSQREITPEKGFLGTSTVTVGCQTPPEWLDCGPAQQGNEAVPGRAPPLKRALTICTHSPHPPASRAFAR